MLLARNHPDDQDKRVMLLNEALAIARGLGMYTLEGRITTRVEHVAALPKAPSPHSDDLSPCEEVFAAGHAEAGNDMPLPYSTMQAERVDGDYCFTGRKAFGSLTLVWTYLGIHGMDTSDPAAPCL
jgi:hypothetical protein